VCEALRICKHAAATPECSSGFASSVTSKHCAAQRTRPEFHLQSSSGDGLNSAFGQTVQFIVAEPNTTFLRFSVTDSGHEVAYQVYVLSRLRSGYRAVQLRGPLGTRIELCYLFIRLKFEDTPNLQDVAPYLKIISRLQEACGQVAACGQAEAETS